MEIIVSLMIGITEGDSIPAVKLTSENNGRTYYIPSNNELDDIQDGGHHRVFASYLLGKPLKIKNSEEFEVIALNNFPITDCSIISNPKTFAYERIVNGKHYRPLPKLEEFFDKYSLVNSCLKLRNGRDYSFSKESYLKSYEEIERLTENLSLRANASSFSQ